MASPSQSPERVVWRSMSTFTSGAALAAPDHQAGNLINH